MPPFFVVTLNVVTAMYEWDEAKSASTRLRRGFSFDIMEGFLWDYAVCVEVQTTDDEEREKYIGPIGQKLFVAIVTQRNDRIRVISLRRATQREITVWKREVRND